MPYNITAEGYVLGIEIDFGKRLAVFKSTVIYFCYALGNCYACNSGAAERIRTDFCNTAV